MRILWADDQAEVVNTLRPLLSPLKAKVVEARTGEEALRLLAQSEFDLILLDLQMPPDQWGGLWFLERRAEAGITTPVLVLSGEGQQRETIRALRLGVADYVAKEEVERELVARIQVVVAEEEARHERELVNSAPAPIAIPLKRYLNAVAPAERLHRLLELYEAILRLAAFLALSEVRAVGGDRAADGSVIGMLIAPAMGSWNAVRIAISSILPEDAITRRFEGAINARATERMIKVRNDLAHGGEPSEVVAKELLGELRPTLVATLARLRRTSCDLVITRSMKFDGTDFAIDGVAARGDSPAFSPIQLKSSSAVATDHVYAVGGAGRHLIDLHPLIIANTSREPGAWSLCLFDGIRGVRASNPNLEGAEPLRYANLWSGQRDVAIDPLLTSADLRKLTADW